MEMKKNFIYNIILMISQYIVPLIIYPYISRIFGIEKIGLINWIDSIINYFILFSTMGIGIEGVRAISTLHNDKVEQNKVFCEITALHIICTTLIIILYITLVEFVYKLNIQKELFYIGCIKIASNAFLVEWYYKGLEKFKLITTRTILVKITYVAFIITFIKKPTDIYLYFLFTSLVVFFNALINCLYLKKEISISYKNINIFKHVKAYMIVGFYLISTSFYTTFNVTYLGITSSPIAVGAYTTALKIYTIILGIFSAFNSALIPRLNYLIKENVSDFHKIVNKSISYVLTFSIPIVVNGIMLAPQIVTMISGYGYSKAIMCFRLVLPLIIIVGFAQVLSNQILMTLKKDKKLLQISLIGGIVGIFLNLLLVHNYHEIGSSITILVSEICVTAILYKMAYQYIHVSISLETLAKNIVVCILYVLTNCVLLEEVKNVYLALIYSVFINGSIFIFSQKFYIKNKLLDFLKISTLLSLRTMLLKKYTYK